MSKFSFSWKKFIIGFNLNNEEEKRDLLLHLGLVAIVGLTGVILTVSLFLFLRHYAWDSFQTVFMQRAMNRAKSFSQELDRQIDRMDGLRRFMDARESVDRQEFSQYVEPLLKGVPVRAFEWAPRVSHVDRLFMKAVPGRTV